MLVFDLPEDGWARVGHIDDVRLVRVELAFLGWESIGQVNKFVLRGLVDSIRLERDPAGTLDFDGIWIRAYRLH